MLRSLFAGISGLRANQTALDVVGNNIANANTTGFKSSNVVFQDTLAQMLTAGSAPGGNQGGTNPIQVGLGVSVGGTTTNFGQGSAQVTGRTTDMMIEGDGFFVVERGGEKLYTRAGAFNFDANGNLVTLDGDIVQGMVAPNLTTLPATADNAYELGDVPAQPDPANSQNITLQALADEDSGLTSLSIGADGVITGVFEDGSKFDLARVMLANFANPEGLEKAGDTAFRASNSSGAVQYGPAKGGQMGTIRTSALEMSNVDLAAEFTNLIIAQRGFQATSRVITTSDQVLEELVNIKR
jgi:flagellar hook protein FlgE